MSANSPLRPESMSGAQDAVPDLLDESAKSSKLRAGKQRRVVLKAGASLLLSVIAPLPARAEQTHRQRGARNSRRHHDLRGVLRNSWGGTRTRDPGIMSAVLLL